MQQRQLLQTEEFAGASAPCSDELPPPRVPRGYSLTRVREREDFLLTQ